MKLMTEDDAVIEPGIIKIFEEYVITKKKSIFVFSGT